MIHFLIAQASPLQGPITDLQDAQTLDSAILGEQFYFFTVVLMWLIHVGFMTYETGRRTSQERPGDGDEEHPDDRGGHSHHVLHRLVDLQLQPAGLPADRAEQRRLHQRHLSERDPVVGHLRAQPDQQHQSGLLPGLPLFSWTTASIMSGSLLERVRLSAYLVLACLLGSVVWMLDAAWGWSAGGWMTLRFGFHDSIASAVVHGVSGAFTLGVLFNLGPRIGKYTKEGLTRTFRPHNIHMTLDGADADLHGLLRLLRRLPGDRVNDLPRVGEHLPQPHHARLDRDDHHLRVSREDSPAPTSPAVATRSGPSRAGSRV